jgi:quercetin dioxygenase-like cupin family protein
MSLDDRLRPPARERLADQVQRFDLTATAADLRAEPHAPVSGHRQMALARHGPLSLILFAFEVGGAIKEHRTEGEVVVQVLRGRITVTVDGDAIELSQGELLSLAPGQPHAVYAREASDMLLTICRDPGASDGA